MKTNLKDCTFLIQMRLDSIDRLVNLKSTVEFILKNFDTNIHVLEADGFNSKLIQSVIPDKVKYTFKEDFDPIFFRTNYTNQMVRECPTPFIVNWEPDVIAPPEQVVQAVELLRSGEADFSYPYEHYFLDTSKILRELYITSQDLNVLIKHQKKMMRLYAPNPVGGAFFANRIKFIESGIENLNYYGWGIEDGERYVRWEGLGYSIKRVKGNLYHLTHHRGLNSNFHSVNQRKIKKEEIDRIRMLSKNELESEVKSWNN